MDADLVTYLESLNPLDHQTHCRLAHVGLLPALPAERIAAALATEIRREDVTAAEWDLSTGHDVEWEVLGINSESPKNVSAEECVLLQLPRWWNYLNRCPLEFQAAHSAELLVRLTEQYTGWNVTRINGSAFAQLRAFQVAESIIRRLPEPVL